MAESWLNGWRRPLFMSSCSAFPFFLPVSTLEENGQESSERFALLVDVRLLVWIKNKTKQECSFPLFFLTKYICHYLCRKTNVNKMKIRSSDTDRVMMSGITQDRNRNVWLVGSTSEMLWWAFCWWCFSTFSHIDFKRTWTLYIVFSAERLKLIPCATG